MLDLCYLGDSLKMGSASFDQLNNYEIVDEQIQDSLSHSSSCSSEVLSSFSSSDSDSFGEEEEGEDSSGSSCSPTSGSSQHSTGPLQNMSSLLQQLPSKRGLSKHYNGKSQSFTSLSNVISLEDLAKPENPYNNKKLKSCKSYAVFLQDGLFESTNKPPPRSSSSSRLSSKETSLGGSRRNASSFLGNNNNRPPPHRSPSTACFRNQTPLFA